MSEAIVEEVDEQEESNEVRNPNEYLTPYPVTVIYKMDNYFETTIANVVSNAQRIPFGESSDLNLISDSIEYLTPLLLVMGDYLSREQVMKLLQKGYPDVRIFCRESNDSADKYKPGCKQCTVDMSNPEAEQYVYCEQCSAFSKYVTVFGLEQLYQNVKIDGMLSVVLVEKMTYCEFPNFYEDKSKRNSATNELITAKSSKNLKQGIISTKRNFGEVVSEMVLSWKGFEMESNYTMRGELIETLHAEIVLNRVKKYGRTSMIKMNDVEYSVFSVPTTELLEVTREYLTQNNKSDLFIMYRPVADDLHGYELYLSSTKIDIDQFLQTYLLDAKYVAKTSTSALTRCDNKTMYEMLPYLG